MAYQHCMDFIKPDYFYPKFEKVASYQVWLSAWDDMMQYTVLTAYIYTQTCKSKLHTKIFKTEKKQTKTVSVTDLCALWLVLKGKVFVLGQKSY